MSSSTTPPPSKTYTGSCHCARFQYTVTHSPPLTDPSCKVAECNCSICTRNGYLLIYVPHENFVLDKGTEDEFQKYTFAPNHRYGHYFCPSCGTSCFVQSLDPRFFGDLKAVNVRTFHDLDLKGLTLIAVDGKSVKPE